MAEPLHILVVDDSEDDTALVVRELRRAEYDVHHHRVDTAQDLRQALDRGPWDVIISDYNMPSFTGMEAFMLVKSLGLDIPFMFFSGTIGEERAVDAMKRGVHDYVMKDRIARLVPAVEHAVRDAELRRVKRNAEEALHESEERFRAAFENAAVGRAVIDSDGRFVQVNRALCAIAGCTERDLLSSVWYELVHAEDIEGCRLQASDLLSGKRHQFHIYARLLHTSGETLWVSISAVLIHPSNTKESFAIVDILDLTDRKQWEEANARLVAAVEQASDIMVVTDAKGIVQYTNPAAQRILGYGVAELLGLHLSFPNSPKRDEKKWAEIQVAMDSGACWGGTIPLCSKSGVLVQTATTVTPVRDSSDTVVNFVMVMRDVTEETKIYAQLRQAQKMEAIGTLAGGIAHDFNNILSALIGYTDLAKKSLEHNHKAVPYLDHVLSASHRAADLVRHILTFSRQRDVAFQEVQVELIAREALKLLRASLPASIEISESIEEDSGAVWGDVTQIHQVVMNLCTNAYHAMLPKGGVLTLGLRGLELDARTAQSLGDLKPGHYLELRVQDTGHGMDRQTIERIFDPYFTTKPLGEGTGLGLSIVHGIIDEHGGAVAVYSELNRGTVFKVYLPCISTTESKPEQNQSILPRGTERILVVDDEEILTRMLNVMLSGLGYKVTAKTSPVAALVEFIKSPSEYDIILTDLTMPKLSGLEFSVEALKVRPHVPIILMTGYVDELTDQSKRSSGIRDVISKPFTESDLATIVRRVLDEPV